jgi:GcrA cell cycle regulator
MAWTDERVELLKKMWGEGQSASQIAKELGGVTRNAVIGKVHRLGLSNRAGAGAGAAKAEAPREAAKPKAKSAAKPAARPAAEPVAGDAADAAPAQAEAASAEMADQVEAAEVETAAPPPAPARKQIIPAGQPLPPQPSANEISPEALAKVSEIEKKAKRLSLMELTERTCKWPVGDPATDDFWFCGLPVQQGKPYCEAHVGVAFQPMSARRDRKR